MSVMAFSYDSPSSAVTAGGALDGGNNTYDMSSSALPPISQEFVRPSTRETRRPATSAGILQRVHHGGLGMSSTLAGGNDGYNSTTGFDLGGTFSHGFEAVPLDATSSAGTPTPGLTPGLAQSSSAASSAGAMGATFDQLQQQQRQMLLQQQQQRQAMMMQQQELARRQSDNDFAGVFAHTVDGPAVTLPVDPADFRRQSGGTYSSGQLHPAVESYLASMNQSQRAISTPNIFARPVTSNAISFTPPPMSAVSSSRPPTAPSGGGILHKPSNNNNGGGIMRPPGSAGRGSVRFDAPPPSKQKQQQQPTTVKPNALNAPMLQQSNIGEQSPQEPSASSINNRRASEPFFKHVANQVNLPSHAKLYQQLGLQGLFSADGKVPDPQLLQQKQQQQQQQQLFFQNGSSNPSFQELRISTDGLTTPFGDSIDPLSGSSSVPSYIYNPAAQRRPSMDTSSVAPYGLMNRSSLQSTTNPTSVVYHVPGQQVFDTSSGQPVQAFPQFAPDYKFGDAPIAAAGRVDGSLQDPSSSMFAFGNAIHVQSSTVAARNDSTSTASSRHPYADPSRGSFSSDVNSASYRKTSSEYDSQLGHSTSAGGADSGAETNTGYSYRPSSGPVHKKRPRRKFDQIERLYLCGFQGCEKSYGTLNHLNAHVYMQKHGQKRRPEGEFQEPLSISFPSSLTPYHFVPLVEFKEIRKAWRKQKKEEARMAQDRVASIPVDSHPAPTSQTHMITTPVDNMSSGGFAGQNFAMQQQRQHQQQQMMMPSSASAASWQPQSQWLAH